MHTAGLWMHTKIGINFYLIVDDFGIKNIDRADADHLLAALEELHEVTTNWCGTLFLGMKIAWDYTNATINIPLPGYTTTYLDRFQNPTSGRTQHSPHAWTKPQYGSNPQLTPPPDDSAPILPAELMHIQ
jgi:hypothetical protein